RVLTIYDKSYLMLNPALRWAWDIEERDYWQEVFELGTLPDGEGIDSEEPEESYELCIQDYPIPEDLKSVIRVEGNIAFYEDTGEVAYVFPTLKVNKDEVKQIILSEYCKEQRYKHEKEKLEEPLHCEFMSNKVSFRKPANDDLRSYNYNRLITDKLEQSQDTGSL
ncbi:hypothetical protein, partial [Pleionea sp. CnH1-48]|uniref:hypothetical protein n=1 Tax=Pleionea sp. CnH1-48 TaxID=2954494 RepID=UPI0020968BA2